MEIKVKHSEIKPIAESVQDDQLSQYNCAFLIQTQTTFNKTIIDSTERFREWASNNGVVSYEELSRGDENGKEVEAFLLDEDRWIQALVKFYRPKSAKQPKGRQRTDRRLSISILDERVDQDEGTFSNFVAPGSIVYFFENRGYLYMIPIRQGLAISKQLENQLIREFFEVIGPRGTDD